MPESDFQRVTLTLFGAQPVAEPVQTMVVGPSVAEALPHLERRLDVINHHVALRIFGVKNCEHSHFVHRSNQEIGLIDRCLSDDFLWEILHQISQLGVRRGPQHTR